MIGGLHAPGFDPQSVKTKLTLRFTASRYIQESVSRCETVRSRIKVVPSKKVHHHKLCPYQYFNPGSIIHIPATADSQKPATKTQTCLCHIAISSLIDEYLS